MAMGSSGSGITAGSTTGASLEARVSPVEVSASLATAPMSPATTSSAGSWALPRTVSRWPTRSSLRLVALNTVLSGRNVPDTTRNRFMRPT